MSFFLPKSVDPIYLFKRSGTAEDPYVPYDEDKKVNVQRVFLTEIPDRTEKVNVKEDGDSLVESNSPNNLSDGQYYVDYTAGIVYHAPSEEGKTLQYIYKGVGVLQLPSTRISLQDSNKDVSKTLQQYMDEIDENNQEANASIDTMNDVVADTNDAKNRANEASQYAEEQGDRAKELVDDNQTKWLTPPLANLSEVENTHDSPSHGDTIMTTDEGKVYRYENGQWKHTQTIVDTPIADIQAELSQQDQQTKSLHHGTQVIESDQSSPLKVEFYGNTLVNLLGKYGNFETDSNSDGLADGWTESLKGAIPSLESSSIIGIGNNVQRITATTDDTATTRRIRKGFNIKSGKHYLVATLTELSGTDGEINVVKSDGNLLATRSSNGFLYIKFTAPADEEAYVDLYNRCTLGDTHHVQYDGVRVYEIDQSTYDAIGVSLTDSDVERLFPYTSSVTHVKNPVLSVSGSQLLEGTPDEINENATLNRQYDLELNATSAGQTSSLYSKVAPNQTYTINLETNGRMNIYSISESGVYTSIVTGQSSFPYTFNTLSDEKLEVRFTNPSSGMYTFKNWILNLGDKALPFVEKNDSYLYAEVTLAGNSNEKDTFYQSDGTWYKEKNIEPKLLLDGSLGWEFNTDYTSYKRVRIPSGNPSITNVGSDIYRNVVKHDGSILESSTAYDESDQFALSQDGFFTMTISDTDSGWTDAMEPTADMIKGYFNGWQYTGDGTTHSWVSIVDGTTTPSTQSEAFVADPTNSPSDYKNYFLSYQLADPATENVDHLVEGSLSIEGDAQVYVDSGIVPREHTVPSYNPNNDQWYINEKGIATSIDDNPLNNKVSQILKIFKNGKDDTDNWEIYEDGYNQNGSTLARINDEDYDSTATYSVRYRPFKYDFTTNNNDVKVTYQNSLKSAFQANVTKTTDIATDVSILDRQMLDVLIRLDSLESGGA